MANLLVRIWNAFKLFVWAMKNPYLLKESNFKVMSDLLTMIIKVSKEERPMMSHVGFINPDTGDKVRLVSLWAGCGMSANPTDRIAELVKENNMLKAKLESKTNKEDKQ